MKHCGVCSNPHSEDMLETHHRVPRHLKGSDDPSNLIDICPNCHTAIHDLSRLLKIGQSATAAYLETNYHNKRKAQKLLIELAKVIVAEEEEIHDKDFIKVPLTLPVEIHRKLRDSSKSAKCSMHKYIEYLIEKDYRMNNERRGTFDLRKG
jgi:hypothetical protein